MTAFASDTIPPRAWCPLPISKYNIVCISILVFRRYDASSRVVSAYSPRLTTTLALVQPRHRVNPVGLLYINTLYSIPTYYICNDWSTAVRRILARGVHIYINLIIHTYILYGCNNDL